MMTRRRSRGSGRGLTPSSMRLKYCVCIFGGGRLGWSDEPGEGKIVFEGRPTEHLPSSRTYLQVSALGGDGGLVRVQPHLLAHVLQGLVCVCGDAVGRSINR